MAGPLFEDSLEGKLSAKALPSSRVRASRAYWMNGPSSSPGVTCPPLDCDISLLRALGFSALSAAAMAICALLNRTLCGGRLRVEVLR